MKILIILKHMIILFNRYYEETYQYIPNIDGGH